MGRGDRFKREWRERWKNQGRGKERDKYRKEEDWVKEGRTQGRE